MRHQVKGRKLNRSKKHRESLFANLMAGLFQHGQIKTTQAKAKAVQSIVEKTISIAKKGSVADRRNLAQIFGKRDIVNNLVDKIAKNIKERTSGFTRIVNLGERKGDNASMVRLELVEFEKVVVKKEAVKKATTKPKVASKAKSKSTKETAKKEEKTK